MAGILSAYKRGKRVSASAILSCIAPPEIGKVTQDNTTYSAQIIEDLVSFSVFLFKEKIPPRRERT